MKKTNTLMKSFIIIAFFSILLAGCSYSTHFVQTGSRAYEETNAENVKIFSGEPQEDYTVIGSIAVWYAGNSESGIVYLQEKSALIGANAVIHTRLSTVNSSDASFMANGVAVKFKK